MDTGSGMIINLNMGGGLTYITMDTGSGMIINLNMGGGLTYITMDTGSGDDNKPKYGWWGYVYWIETGRRNEEQLGKGTGKGGGQQVRGKSEQGGGGMEEEYVDQRGMIITIYSRDCHC